MNFSAAVPPLSSSPRSPKRALVTGGTGAIGQAIVAGLVEAGCEVTLLGRNRGRAEELLESLRRRTPTATIRFVPIDLSSASALRELARNWADPLSLLVNAAAIAPRSRTESSDGIELQWAVNVLSYFRLVELFREALAAAAPSRVVNVASYWAGDLDIDDVEFRRRRYSNGTAYRQSKQANRMLTVTHAEALSSTGITINSCHPGDVNSRLSNDLGFGGHETPEQGARTPLFLALSSEVEGITGRYFSNCREAFCPFSRDRSALRRLHELCLRYG
ncbi:MAG: SDR family NAD(P)-dependent oxidoreductase [Candidatus Hydrogenedentota bacterium]|nr:MAG: SDR family NAD(P)-dependent oxidoreductase [Candidatus Hydrogenedentota bacterium]